MGEAKQAAPIVSIKLVKPHTHGGRDYAEGTELVLAEVEMSQADAVWLVGLGVATAAS